MIPPSDALSGLRIWLTMLGFDTVPCTVGGAVAGAVEMDAGGPSPLCIPRSVITEE